MSWNDANEMLHEDFDFEVANIFNQMQPIENLVASIQADRQHEFMLGNRARRITRAIRRVARANRRGTARYWPRLSRGNRRYREPGITRIIQSYS